MTTFSLKDLQQRYADKTALVRANCKFATDLVGGVPATPEGVQFFVQHQLKLTGDEAIKAANRILNEEIGKHDMTPEEGELIEDMTYGINLIRRDEVGPWLGDWMIKANLKAAASRIGLFTTKRGAKGDMAELGQVRAVGISAIGEDNPNRIYIRNREGTGPAATEFQWFRGCVTSPQGKKSIVTRSECAPAGSRFSFEYRFYDARITDNDIADTFACAMVIGLGSVKAFERGKFSIEKLEIDRQAKKVKEIAAA